jgi:uncharacterized protein
MTWDAAVAADADAHPASGERFAADCMLGRLARWLRVIGCDVAYERAVSDEDLIARCARERRLLLTRDTRLAARRLVRSLGTRVLLVASDRPGEQLLQVLRDLGLKPEPGRLLTRCLECNEPIVQVDRAAVEGRVPPFVFATQDRFARCPACGRVYWRATHVEGMLTRLAGALGQAADPGPADRKSGPRGGPTPG